MNKPYVVLLLILLAGGCSYDEMASSLIPEEESRFAKEFLEKIHEQDLEYVKSRLDAELQSEMTDESLLEVAEYFPGGELFSIEIIGSRTHLLNSQWEGNFSFELQFSDGWAVAGVALKRESDELLVTGFNVYQTRASQRELTAFSAAPITPVRLIILLMTIIVPAFMFFTCYMVYRTPIPEKKKRWYFFSFLGIFDFSFNWTTEILNFQLLAVKILGAGAVAASPYSPWIFTVTFPIGAIAFWVKRKELMVSEQPGPPGETGGDVPPQQQN